ncbi:MAG: carboxypeptidase regulatory-like domain-containing protein [Bryobacteraceae bacterium]
MRILSGILFVLLVSFQAFGQQPEQRLPVKRIILYKTGVGYFEHLGAVRGNQQISIPFTSGQLNDVLKSLTVIDLNGGQIGAITYNSSAPVDRQMGDLHLPLSEKPSLTEFLGALRGAKVEIHSGPTTLTGRLLSVERKTRTANNVTTEVDYVSLVADNGEIRTTEISPSFSFRPLEAGLPAKVDRFLDLASSSRDPDIRRMVVSTTGTGDRSIMVSYLSEVPVWKSNYRIVLNSKTPANSLLQGWAIVDNTIGQDWENVELSLVAGAPQSFVQQLAQPYYVRRPEVPLPDTASTTPQTYQSTLNTGGARATGNVSDPSGAAVVGARITVYGPNGELLGAATADAQGNYEVSGLPDGPVRIEAQAPGFSPVVINEPNLSAASLGHNIRLNVGQVSESVSVNAMAPPPPPPSAAPKFKSSVGTGRALGRGTMGGAIGAGSGGGVGGGTYRIDDARAAMQASAAGQNLGELFEYKLKQPITIHRNESALVPILQTTVACEKVSVWNPSSNLPRPQRALWLTNTSGLTLDTGSFNVIDDEAFAGEGLTNPISPGEKRLLSYALDLALTVSTKNSSEPQRVTRVVVKEGVMIQHNEIREKRVYTLRNQDTTPRTAVIEHPVRSGYQLAGAIKPAETTADWMRFRLAIEPKQTAELTVEERRPIDATYAIGSITKEQLTAFLKMQAINKPIEDSLRQIIEKRAAVNALQLQKNRLDTEQAQIFDDQQRLRENIKAMKGGTEERALVLRYTQQLNTQESRLDAIKKETAALDARIAKAEDEVNAFVVGLNFDATL